MGSSNKTPILISSFLVLLLPHFIFSSDPDIISDFSLPQNTTTTTTITINGSFFTYTGLRPILTQIPPSFRATKATLLEFPALNGQSISYALFQYPPGTINPPHTHPRASELLFLLHGSLQVGFVDTKRNLYTQVLEAGDMFVFPKGMIHYQYNPSGGVGATALAAFGSANAGTVSVPVSVFGSGIDEVVLAMAFKVDVSTVKKIVDGVRKS